MGMVIPGYTFDMKTAISVPDDVFRRVEERAARLGVSRSAFYATAAARYLADLEGDDLTAQIDAAIERSGARAQDEQFEWAAATSGALGTLDDDEW